MSERMLTDQQLIGAFGKLDQRLNYMGQNVVQLGLHMEYLIEKIKAARDSEGNPLIVLDLENEFLEFAERRSAEIDEEVSRIRSAMENKGVNLDDTQGQ
jgi:hypothetical protein